MSTVIDTSNVPLTDRAKARRARWWRDVGWRHVIGVVAVVYSIFPLVFAVNIALSPGTTGLPDPSKLFQSVSGQQFVTLFTNNRPETQVHFLSWLGNTLIVGLVTAIGTVLMGGAAAYAFSRFRYRGRRTTLTALLIIQMFPQMLAFVAVFLLLKSLGEVIPVLGQDSLIALICVYLGGALGVNTFLMYGFFNTVPMSLDEAAKIDGATHAQIFWTIILRLVAPVLAVVGLLSFISSFSEYIIAKLVLTTPTHWTIAVGLYSLVANDRYAAWGLFAAGALIAALPVLVLFLFLQRYIVSGLTAGAVKG
ncbi:MAG: sugar ABC transporter permease [Bifidobacteriaceae bacterium]|jgi:arabinogalactan oligomer/maltooligosaccharide transport system permease protein|nr:sugar ABC transporter permease [Bifidobacteriaceae bacterium]